MAKVFVYKIPRATATGLEQFSNDSSGKSLRKTKMGRATDNIRALYDPKLGGYANGISYVPWLDEEGVQKVDTDGRLMTLQDKLEQKWRLPKGFLANRPWRKGDSNREEDLTYYMRKSWRMKDGCTVFDTADMDEELGYYVLLASSICANSEREYLDHKWPRAQFYIALENESEEIKYSKNEIKTKAFAALHSEDFTDVMKRKFVSLLDLSSSKAILTPQQVHNLLFEFIDKSSFTPGSNIDKFNSVARLLSTPDGRETLEARYMLKQAVDSRVVTERQDIYIWNRPQGPMNIGDRYAEAVDFFLNPRKAAEVEEMMVEVKRRLNNN